MQLADGQFPPGALPLEEKRFKYANGDVYEVVQSYSESVWKVVVEGKLCLRM
jgi:hypothetical protein